MSVDIILPGGNKAALFAVVRHITTKDNKIILVGFEVLDIDAIGEVHYDEFLASLNQ